MKLVPTLTSSAMVVGGYIIGARVGALVGGIDGAIIGSGLGAGYAGGLLTALNRFQAGTLASDQTVPNVNAPPTKLSP
jgi:hypothetical protein